MISSLINLLKLLTVLLIILRLISVLKPKLSAGVDHIPSIVLRYFSDNALNALTYIFNQSLGQGKFVSELKKAKVILVFKKGNSKNVLNYRPLLVYSRPCQRLSKKLCTLDCIPDRPLALLSSLSKTLEKIVHIRLHSFININNNISQQEFRFRHKHSTNDATTLLIRT